MIQLEVRLFANLRDYHPEIGRGDSLHIKLDDHARMSDLIAQLKVPRKEISMMMVNGKHVKEDHPLKDGDRVGIFPLIGGG